MSKLGLDQATITNARRYASSIADSIDALARSHTTVAVERTVLRLCGVDGADDEGIPFVNHAIDRLVDAGRLGDGIHATLASAMIHTGEEPQAVCEALAFDELDLATLPQAPDEAIDSIGRELADDALSRLRATRAERERRLRAARPRPDGPLLYVIVATGNIYEDAVQARVAARQGAEIIAVIRSTGQSLLDYVPQGPTTEGYGGTYATQANFRIVREALDEVGDELGRYIRLCNYCSGLCMPEIAAMGALERLDVMLNDALYGILFRDINPKRTFIDQYFSRTINALAGVIINTGEDNYLTTADALEAAHTVLASQFINEQVALRCGLERAQMGLGHAMEIDPLIENGFLLELAQAQMAREIFPEAPLKYMPPTKYMTGNIFRGHIQDALFNLIGSWTDQGIQLLGMMTEAMHTPHMGDRYLSLENARYVMNATRALGSEVEFREGGIMRARAKRVLDEAVELLQTVESEGMFEALARGAFADVFRPSEGGKGLAGVAPRSARYRNPIEEAMRSALGLKRSVASG